MIWRISLCTMYVVTQYATCGVPILIHLLISTFDALWPLNIFPHLIHTDIHISTFDPHLPLYFHIWSITLSTSSQCGDSTSHCTFDPQHRPHLHSVEFLHSLQCGVSTSLIQIKWHSHLRIWSSSRTHQYSIDGSESSLTTSPPWRLIYQIIHISIRHIHHCLKVSFVHIMHFITLHFAKLRILQLHFATIWHI